MAFVDLFWICISSMRHVGRQILIQSLAWIVQFTDFQRQTINQCYIRKKRDFQTFISVIISQNFSCLHVWGSIVWLLSQRENTAHAKYECCMPVWEIVNRLWKSGMWTPAGVETVTWSLNAAWGLPVITGFVKLYLVAFTVNRNPVTWNLAAEQALTHFMVSKEETCLWVMRVKGPGCFILMP